MGTTFAAWHISGRFHEEDVMAVKKSTRAKAPQTEKKSTTPANDKRVDASTDSKRMIGAAAVLLVCCVMAAAMLLAARESSSPGTGARVDGPSETAVAQAGIADKQPLAPSAKARMSTSKPDAAAAKSTVQKSAFVTITGCLERNNDAFRLTNTDGSDAPRSRSWKSGFLKRGPASVEMVDQANRVKLATHVGQRVSVTGPLEDRQMQVRSLRPIAPACD
jgi:hypothetical protein